jgi:hypothetical protein
MKRFGLSILGMVLMTVAFVTLDYSGSIDRWDIEIAVMLCGAVTWVVGVGVLLVVLFNGVVRVGVEE